MPELCKSELCTGCSACAAACVHGCIQMHPDTEGFLRPVIDQENCLNCGICVQTCPVLAEKVDHKGSTIAYAVMHKEDEMRRVSTSGGVFSVLSKWVLEQGGVVFGAAYSDTYKVEHRCAQEWEKISPLRGAKYAQSAIGSSFVQVKSLLEKGQYVLFSGTPCQTEGLRAFLRKDHDKLILVDMICHGAASPAVWQSYIRYRSLKDANGDRPIEINLRSKETGWPRYSVHFDYANGKSYSAVNFEDPFLRGYVGNLYLRPSCYQCSFKGAARSSDFTLGDYWGVWSQLPEYDDGKGVSLLLLHTEKARTLWEKVGGQAHYQEVDSVKALEENPSALKSSVWPEAADGFKKSYTEADFGELIETLLPRPELPKKPSLVQRAFGRLKRILE